MAILFVPDITSDYNMLHVAADKTQNKT